MIPSIMTAGKAEAWLRSFTGHEPAAVETLEGDRLGPDGESRELPILEGIGATRWLTEAPAPVGPSIEPSIEPMPDGVQPDQEEVEQEFVFGGRLGPTYLEAPEPKEALDLDPEQDPDEGNEFRI